MAPSNKVKVAGLAAQATDELVANDQGAPADWIVPQWPAPAWVRALVSSRAGGVSLPPYASMNLGDHVQDDSPAVARNRQIWQQATGVPSVFLQQVHGVEVAELSASSAQGEQPLVADASCTQTPGVACTILVADCLPVLICHAQQRVVGAAHAGWRSLAGQQGRGVLEQLLQHLRALCPAASADGWLAWLGPCIGPRAFEVGNEVRAAFVETQPEAATCFVAQPATGSADQPSKWLADLAGLARLRLAALGVPAVYGNDGSADWCTFSQAQRFFSYRRDGASGRMAASIWLVD
ncbi:MAG: peptidoglycan editing factor PgeF [Brachymonas sp.]|nr:peptidoglycan editing factor PgeF [Brachymonas sp.]